MADIPPRPVLVRQLIEPDESRRQLARSALAGESRRVVRGGYLPSETWDRLSQRERYLARVVGVALTRRSRPVLSHWSAAAIHGLPALGAWPAEVHITVGPASGGRSRNGVIRHPVGLDDDDVVELGELLLTSVSRTVLDLAASSSFMAAVVVVDRALHVDRFDRTPPLATREDLEAAWERARPFRAHARTRAVFAFAETRADSPLESVSRVTMRTIGVPRPTLQAAFSDRDGVIGESDFYWEQHRVVGEADGEHKYLDETLRRGRTVEQVMLAEKYREDRLRALTRGFARWPWKVGIDPGALRRKLVAAGLPVGVPW